MKKQMEKIKVIHLSKSRSGGGAAIAASRIVNYLQAQGVHASLIVQNKLGVLYFIIEKLIFLIFETDKSMRFYFSIPVIGARIKIKNTDIIHLHWVNGGFLSLRRLRKIVNSNIPVVWTMHDMWPITGGCHYSTLCDKFVLKTNCYPCPYTRTRIASVLLKKKRDIMSKVTIVTPSNWLASEVRAAGFEATVIHNPIKEFYPINRLSAHEALGLPSDRKYILFGAVNINNPLKGVERFSWITDRLKHLDNLSVIIFGKEKHEIDFGLHTIRIPYIDSIDTLRNVYSVADCFVITSLADNLPNTVIESLMCGTPVVGWDVGGIPEMIEHKKSGYIADNATDMTIGIQHVLNHNLRQKARESAINKYDPEEAITKYINLYKTLLL